MFNAAAVAVVSVPLASLFGGSGALSGSSMSMAPGALFMNWLMLLFTLLFWYHWQVTHDKMVVGARIVDAITGQPPSKPQ